MKRLTGKNVLITGAAGLIGASVVSKCLEQGATVVVGDSDYGRVVDLVERIGDGKTQSRFIIKVRSSRNILAMDRILEFKLSTYENSAH